MASPVLGVCWIFCCYCKKRKPALQIWGDQDLFIFTEIWTIFSWFSMIRSLGFSLHLMDSSLSWFFLVSCLLCTESILIFFFYCNDFFPVCLFIYYLGVCQIIILSLSWLPIQVSFISRSVLLWRILSFLHSFFSPVLILAPPVGYTYIIHSICFSIYSKMHVVLSFRWALYSHSKSIFCSLCSLSLLSL